jgi:hypothetical protein
VISRIVHEILWLFELDAIDKAAANLANKVEKKLFESLMSQFIEQILQPNQMSSPLKQITV